MIDYSSSYLDEKLLHNSKSCFTRDKFFLADLKTEERLYDMGFNCIIKPSVGAIGKDMFVRVLDEYTLPDGTRMVLCQNTINIVVAVKSSDVILNTLVWRPNGATN